MDIVNDFVFKAEQLQSITSELAWFYRIIPRSVSSSSVSFFIDDSRYDSGLIDELELLLGKVVELCPINSEQASILLSKFYLKEEKNKVKSTINASPDSEDFLVNLIREAKSLKSSDIHIETYEARCRVRIRVDGMMIERYALKKEDYPALINKIKIMANLDIAEKRLPQDGRINFHKNQDKFDIRVSVLPTLHGEKVVLRLLTTEATDIDLMTLGFSELDIENYLEGIKRPNGILLISGPTGSGKTTTLYATLKLLNKETRNILTIEDPIEYTLEGINQVQLKEGIGLTFAAALRNFLRQDPDVIMVGEIRDVETANMAIRAALTGHLVLSTIHTNSAWGIVSRLIDMGIPPFLVANTLNTAVAQRLVRALCPNCKQKNVFNNALYPKHFRPFREIRSHYLPIGCEVCHYTGYKGRKAVYEVVPIDAMLSLRIKENVFDVSRELSQRNIKTLAENAFELFEKGETSLDEIYPLLVSF